MGCPTSGGPPLEDAQRAGVQNIIGEKGRLRIRMREGERIGPKLNVG